MPFEEKLTWVDLVVTVLVAGGYSVVVLGQLGDVPAAEIAYRQPLLIAVGVSILLTIIGSILMGIGTGISLELSGRSTDNMDRKDERDKSISRRGDVAAFYVVSAGAVAVLALTMLEYDYFWIANTLYLAFVAGSLVSDVVKLAAYRRGF